MLDELCPIQFIEGINYYEKYDLGDLVYMSSYNELAIQYKAEKSYCLTSVEPFILTNASTQEIEVAVKLYSDYDENPSDIMLSSGSLTPQIPREKAYLHKWQGVALKPVSIIRGNKYWLAISNAQICLQVAEKGVDCVLKARGETKWFSPKDNPTSKIMLRFYGRVLPVTS